MTHKRPISFRFAIVSALSIMCLAAPAWADFEAGADAYHHGDYATALHEWQPLAELGDAAAQYNLGLLYANGQGVPQDYTQAWQWNKQVAAQGDASAQYSLGLLYANGQGVPQDDAQAGQWYAKAALQRHAKAQALCANISRTLCLSSIRVAGGEKHPS